MIASQQLVDQLKVDFLNAELDWVMLSAFESEHDHFHASGSGETLSFSQDLMRHVTITMQSVQRELTLIIMLEGHSGQQATKATINFLGQALVVVDIDFIALLEAKVQPTSEAIQNILIERLT